MKKLPLISVVLTTKNEEQNIARFLESIKRQSYGNIELIVVDNNSTDRTLQISRKYTNNIYNFGPERSAQRNYGAAKAKGKYLVFLDADMELSPNVIEDCLRTVKKLNLKILIIPEKTVGNGLMPIIRKFEREMYLGELNYEVPRFFERKVFFEFDGYDERLTGPEDYDLPYRLSQKYKIGRSKEYLYHHEEDLTLKKLLNKKYYYAKNGALYASKHPRLVWIQGTILFRKVYLKHWRKFLRHPILGMCFIAVRFLETLSAIAGFISAVGILGFFKVLCTWFKK